jgi:predicted nucleic acid-binding protein
VHGRSSGSVSEASYGSRIVPDAAIEELKAKGSADPVVQSVAAAAWLRVVSASAAVKGVADWRLGLGESAVITCALQHSDALVVLDDRQGRRCAAAHGIDVIGTIGVALLAKDAGAIPLLAPVLNDLVKAGMRVSDTVLVHALELAGERSISST